VERQTLTGLAARWIPTITARSPGLDFPPMSTSDKDDFLQKVFDKKNLSVKSRNVHCKRKGYARDKNLIPYK
jgi:hypothetical protein